MNETYVTVSGNVVVGHAHRLDLVCRALGPWPEHPGRRRHRYGQHHNSPIHPVTD